MRTTMMPGRGESLTFMDPALMPWVLITEVYWMSYKLLDRRLYHLGVSASQARVMAVLHYAPKPVKPTTIAILLFQETQSITGIVQRLESRGLMARAQNTDDKRSIDLVLTEAGRSVSEEIARISEELYAELFGAALSDRESRALADALRKVRAAAFKLPETDFKLRRAAQHRIWRE